MRRRALNSPKALAAGCDEFDPRPLARTTARAGLAIAPFVLIIAGLSWSGFGARDALSAFLALTAFGAIGTLGYVALASSLGIEEARNVIAIVSGRLARVRAIGPRS